VDIDLDLRSDVKPAAEPPPRKGAAAAVLAYLWETLRSWGPALLIVLTIRSILGEPFTIPSGSMVPTLAIGDYILVSKLSYGLRVPFTNIEILPLDEPTRGDIVVFIHPPSANPDPWCSVKRVPHVLSGGRLSGPEQPCTTDYIKRIIGLPGDTVEVRHDVVFVNGVEQPRVYRDNETYTDPSRGCGEDSLRAYTENLGGVEHTVLQSTRFEQVMEDYGPTTVPAGHYFMMGDNRDNSLDSRRWGFVPRDYIKGKAKWVWLSFDQCNGNIAGLGGIRWDRLGMSLR
jgi:signal peptidase I